MLTGNNLATVIAAAALTSFLHELNPPAVFWAPFILAPMTLLLGESIPKMLALRAPLAVARFAARPLSALATAARAAARRGDRAQPLAAHDRRRRA